MPMYRLTPGAGATVRARKGRPAKTDDTSESSLSQLEKEKKRLTCTRENDTD